MNTAIIGTNEIVHSTELIMMLQSYDTPVAQFVKRENTLFVTNDPDKLTATTKKHIKHFTGLVSPHIVVRVDQGYLDGVLDALRLGHPC